MQEGKGHENIILPIKLGLETVGKVDGRHTVLRKAICFYFRQKKKNDRQRENFTDRRADRDIL